MEGVDPDTLLEWLQTGAGEERDLQLMALEQLCMLLLMSDNIDRCFENCPPRSFLPALGKIFLDASAPDNILEVTARAITYYLDVSNECTRRITQVDGAVKAICNRLAAADMADRTSKDLAEQCVKLLEHICQREATVVYEAGGLQCMLHLIRHNDEHIHKDTMHSAMSVITRLCGKVDPQDENLLKCGSDLGALLSHDDATIAECALRCFAALTDRFIRKSLDPAELATPSRLVVRLLDALVGDDGSGGAAADASATPGGAADGAKAPARSPAFVSVVLSLLSNLCRGSAAVTDQVTRSPKLIAAIKAVLGSRDERCVMDSLRLADLLIILLCEGRISLPKIISSSSSSAAPSAGSAVPPSAAAATGFDRTHRHLIDAIRQHDTDALIDAVENGMVDSNFIDDVGQSLLNWCAAFGTSDMVIYLCDKGADPNKGQRSSSLHYAACFGRPEIVKILLQHGANPDLHDEEGRTALEKARERNDDGHQQVVQILESPGNYASVERGLLNLRKRPPPPHRHRHHGHDEDEENGDGEDDEDGEDDGDDGGEARNDDGEVRQKSADSALARAVLQQLVPIFCNIYRNSLVGSVRRATLSLVRKCITHLSAKALAELVNSLDDDQQQQQQQHSCTAAAAAGGGGCGGDASPCDFVANLMGVLVTVFGYDEDVEGKELALLIMKDLLEKDTEFWLEQLIRLGVYEKVESLVNSDACQLAAQLAAEKTDVEMAEEIVKEEKILTADSPLHFESEKAPENRSVSATPSVGSLCIRMDADSRASGKTSQLSVAEELSAERSQMLNIPVESDTTEATVGGSDVAVATPSPTVEGGGGDARKRASPSRSISSASNGSAAAVYPRISSQFASVRADLVEAATAVAQVLGVQIVDDETQDEEEDDEEADDGADDDDAPSTSAARITAPGGSGGKKRAASTPSGAEADASAWKLTPGVSYKWNDWRLLRNRDSLFIWCDAVVMEFSDGSNGWLRYLMDGKLNTMYSSGNSEACTDEMESRAEFVAKIQRAKAAVPPGAASRAIFAPPPRAGRALASGNWQLACEGAEASQLAVTNVEGGPNARRVLIKADLPGFVFENGKSTVKTFSAESTLGLDFVTGWAARGGGRRLRFRAEAQRQKLHELAKELWDDYLKEAKTKPRDALISLQDDAAKLRALVGEICADDATASDAKVEELTRTLFRVRDAINNERLLSTFELSISSIVPALLRLLEAAFEEEHSSKVITRCFSQVFHNAADLSRLVRRIVLVLESAERFSQQLYDAPGGSPFGLQLLTRRFQLRLEHADAGAAAQRSLMTRTDRTMKAEPLATVGALRQFLYGMVARNWYDYPRAELAFVKQIKEAKANGGDGSGGLKFVYESDFDTNGLMWYLGTNGRTADEWTNPAIARVVNVCSSDDAKQTYGQPSDILSRDVNPLSCHTSDSSDANFTLDLGVWIFPSNYTLRHAQDYGKSALRNWFLQASRDNYVWNVLVAHSDDCALNESGSTATWPVESEDTRQGPYRYFRIAQNGKNSSHVSYVLSLSGFEIYGTVVDVVESELKPLEAPPTFNCLAKPTSSSSSSSAPKSSNTPLSSLIATKKQKQKNATGGFGGISSGAAAAAAKDAFALGAGARGAAAGLSNLQYARPPTASSARHSSARKPKLQKTTAERLSSLTPNSADMAEEEANVTELFRQKLAGGGSSSSSASANPKLRMFRSHRNRTATNFGSAAAAATPSVFGANSDDSAPADAFDSLPPLAPAAAAPPPTLSASLLKVGARVVPGPDSTTYQSSAMSGTVLSVGKSGNGWVEVQWDNGSTNSYRFGHDGKFEVEPQNEANNKASFLSLLASYQRGKALRMASTAPPPPPSKPVGASLLKSAKHFSSAAEPPAGRFGNAAAAIQDEDEEDGEHQQTLKTTDSQNSTTISQKSMSATNLFDDRQKPARYSVASSNQAASAESLQHQTPSLENLLARSRIYTDRIPEIVGDELLASPPTGGGGGSDSRPFGSQEAYEQHDSQNSSIAANTFAGGSQPALSTTSRALCYASSKADSSSEQMFSSSTNTIISEEESAAAAAEKDKVGELTTSFFKHNSADGHNEAAAGGGEDKSKSVSEPDLLESFKPKHFRQIRHQSLVPSANCDDSCEPNATEAEGEEDAKDSTEELREEANDTPTQSTAAAADEKEATAAAVDGSVGSEMMMMDVDYIDHFLNSPEFCERVVGAQSSAETDAAGALGGAPRRPPRSAAIAVAEERGDDFASSDVSDGFLNKYVEDAILQEFMLAEQEGAGGGASRRRCDTTRSRDDDASNEEDFGAPRRIPTTGHSSHGGASAFESALANATAGANRRQLSTIGNGIRLKFGNYAEVLRNMMQQMIDSSGIAGANFEQDELAGDILDEEFHHGAQSLIEDNCDDAAGDFASRHFEVESLASAAAALHQHFSSSGGGALSSAAAAIDAHAGGGSAFGGARNRFADIGVNFSSRASALGDASVASAFASTPPTAASRGGGEPKLNWRQMFLSGGEEGGVSAGASRAALAGVIGEGRSGGSAAASRAAAQKRALRVWEDDYVLRRQFGALIPAFDPRPGRTNVNQTQEVELSTETDVRFTRKGSLVKQLFHHHKSSAAASEADAQRVRLFLRGPNLAGVADEIVELTDNDATIFHYVQELCALVEWGGGGGGGAVGKASEQRGRRIWEPTYTLVYECRAADGRPSAAVAPLLEKSASRRDGRDEPSGLVKECMDLTKLLHAAARRFGVGDVVIADETFHSSKLTQKFTQCLTDPMLVSAAALPRWCGELVFDYPCLFSTETRSMHLRATAFGTSRAIAWLQQRRDQILEQNRLSVPSGANVPGSRREDHYPEYRIGRIKHERIKVHRSEDLLLENAIRVMKFHAMRKSVLEIEYFDEEGTGLGPTLEFYALVAAEFQRKSLAMWMCDDSDDQQLKLEADAIDLGEGAKPPGYYIRRSGGLFPAYLPPGSAESAKVAELFKIFGTFLAKVLLDGRLVDIPLSPTFLNLLLSPSVAKAEEPSLGGVLGLDDLRQIHPLKADFLRSLRDLIGQRDEILASKHLNDREKDAAICGLRLTSAALTDCRVEDLALTFAINPPSKVFGWAEFELVEGGAHVDVTINNVDEYVEKCLEFYLDVGIREQVIAFREGFDLVFPLKALTSFASEEVQVLLFGEQCPKWTRDEILKYTEPKLGYTRDSPGFQRFVDVLAEMSAAERKSFLQFTTGCSSLPPGGLANLHPRLTVVRKVLDDASSGGGGSGSTGSANVDGSYPSVNTCVHYLKLPEYSSAAVLRERLIAATFEKGFHLN